MNDASTTRERADSVTLPPETKNQLNVSASGFLSLGCRPAHHRLSVTLGPDVARGHRNPSHTSVDPAMLRRRPADCHARIAKRAHIANEDQRGLPWDRSSHILASAVARARSRVA